MRQRPMAQRPRNANPRTGAPSKKKLPKGSSNYKSSLLIEEEPAKLQEFFSKLSNISQEEAINEANEKIVRDDSNSAIKLADFTQQEELIHKTAIPSPDFIDKEFQKTESGPWKLAEELYPQGKILEEINPSNIVQVIKF